MLRRLQSWDDVAPGPVSILPPCLRAGVSDAGCCCCNASSSSSSSSSVKLKQMQPEAIISSAISSTHNTISGRKLRSAHSCKFVPQSAATSFSSSETGGNTSSILYIDGSEEHAPPSLQPPALERAAQSKRRQTASGNAQLQLPEFAATACTDASGTGAGVSVAHVAAARARTKQKLPKRSAFANVKHARSDV